MCNSVRNNREKQISMSLADKMLWILFRCGIVEFQTVKLRLWFALPKAYLYFDYSFIHLFRAGTQVHNGLYPLNRNTLQIQNYFLFLEPTFQSLFSSFFQVTAAVMGSYKCTLRMKWGDPWREAVKSCPSGFSWMSVRASASTRLYLINGFIPGGFISTTTRTCAPSATENIQVEV